VPGAHPDTAGFLAALTGPAGREALKTRGFAPPPPEAPTVR
jgi:hypothetical protein